MLGFALAAEADPPAETLFRFGALAFHVLTGRAPDASAPRPSKLNADIDADLEAWLMRVLARDPAARPESAAEALSLLEAAL